MITLRLARATDATAIQKVHKDSIEGIASAFYPADIVKGWTARLGETETISKHAAAIETGAELVVVAEDGERILGFGAIIPLTGELRAVYVCSSAKRAGVGTKILLALEGLAKHHGLKELHMDASLSAEDFYKVHGFEETERKKHRLSSGAEMDCVAMKKLLV